MQTISLRKETNEDKALLLTIYASTRAEEMALIPWSIKQKNAFLAMQFDLQHRHYHENYPDAEFAIILINNNPAGRWYLNRGPEIFHLIDISLLPHYRNQGVGSYLLKTLITEAREHQKIVRLHVETTNKAMRLYQRSGFIAIEEHGFRWLMECKA